MVRVCAGKGGGRKWEVAAAVRVCCRRWAALSGGPLATLISDDGRRVATTLFSDRRVETDYSNEK